MKHAISDLGSTYLFLEHGFLDVDGDGEDCVRSGAVSVHHGLGSFPLLTASLEDAVHLLLGVDLDFLEALNKRHIGSRKSMIITVDIPE